MASTANTTAAKTPGKDSKGGKSSTAVAATRWQDMNQQERDRALSDAQHGNQRALSTVMAGALEDDHLRDLLANLPNHAREYLIATVYGKDNNLMKLTLTAKATQLENDLKGDGKPSPLEQMLIERVVTCWLAAYLADLETEGMLQSQVSLTKAAFYEQRRERAHARHLGAVLALARVRRLLAPVIAQVNIAGPGAQQLNVAAPGSPGNAKSSAPKERDPLALAENQDGQSGTID